MADDASAEREVGPGDDLGVAVAFAVADAVDVDPIDLDPLGWCVDTDALDALLDLDPGVRVRFDYEGCEVTVLAGDPRRVRVDAPGET